MHETNTFSVQKTDMALWRRRDFHRDNEIPVAFRGTRSALGATFEAADKYGWTLIHPVSANANPSGIVTDDAFEQIGGMILEAAERQQPVDGVLLHLHGAMVVDSYEDGEGELLARLRRILGPDVPVVSICAGFSRANIHDVGPSVTITVDMTRGDRRPHGQAVAEEFIDHAWATRDYESFTLLSVAEAVARAREGKPGDKPLVVADYTDNPGGGGYGDATAFLKALVVAWGDGVAFHAIFVVDAVIGCMNLACG